jgi:alpha-tubulin suppressor-like RCC1 family protein
MSQRYPGGVINKNAPVVVGPTGSPPEGGSAPGIWTLEQAAGYIKQGLWPKPLLQRELYSWGNNASGELGLNDVAKRSSPVQVGTLINWSQVSAGEYHSAAITTSGTLFTWGFNAQGQLGLNTAGAITERSSPVQVGALTTWSQVSAGSRFCAAITTSGTLWSWGANNSGQLGQNNTIYRSSPVQVGSLSNWSKVSASVDSNSCAAIKTDGTLWTWGYNYAGQLGHNDTVRRSSPVQVGALTTWDQVSAGNFHCAAIKDGALWTWGNAAQGQLGTGNPNNNQSSPVQVGALTTWSQVKGGYYNCAAIKTDGTLWTWGRNNAGQLGLNDVIGKSSPVQVGSLTTWSQVSAGQDFTIGKLN